MNYSYEFIKFEHTYNLFTKKIQGIKYWHYVRYNVFNEITQNLQKQGQHHTALSKTSILNQALIIIKQLPFFFLKQPLLGLVQKDILIINHPRRIKVDNYFDCIYTDEILSNTDFSYYVFERPYLRKHFNPIRTQNVKYLDYVQTRIRVKSKILQLMGVYKLNSKEIAHIQELTAYINKIFHCQLDPNKLIKIISFMIFYYKAGYPIYNNLIQKINPKLVVEVVSYISDNFIITDIAKKNKIPVVELQHGTIGDKHIAYNFYKPMKDISFPDYLFLFGKHWQETARFPLEKSRLVVTGAPFFEKMKAKYAYHQKTTQRKNIIFISQGSIGHQLSKLALEVSQLLNKENYHLTYKLHPGEYERWQKEYPWLHNNKEISVIDNNENNIYSYLSKADYLVGVYSTAIYESMVFKPKIFIYKVYGHEHMKELYSNGYAELVNNAEEIVAGLNKNNQNTKDISTMFWEEASVARIKTALSSITSQ